MICNMTRLLLPVAFVALSVLFVCIRPCNAFSSATKLSTKDVASKPTSTDKPSGVPVPPLHQNWWPVALINTLNMNSPNSEQVLNKDVVLWHDGEEWRCMDDMCAHRFAPLSEGRIVSSVQDNGSSSSSSSSNNRKCLQCSYHGWDFDGQGTCMRIPQSTDPNSAKFARKVASYPVRIGAGILWVWTDAETSPLATADEVPLPISPMLEQWQDQYPQSAYQRDLPYGYELLTENVIDMSHLPFSHHGVLSDRVHGVPLPFKMLSTAEKEQVWLKECSSVYADPTSAENYDQKILPLYQVEIQKGQAQYCDPIFAVNLMGTNEADENSTSYLGFYPPSHVRYHRTPMSGLASNTELFVCPQSAGRCRVIIFNPFEGGMKRQVEDTDKKRFQFLSKIGNYLLRKVILSKYMGTQNHLMTSDVFDGDNVFLARQGERMAKNGLHYKDYLTPSSADTLSTTFRKWLDVAAESTRQSKCSQADNIVEAAVGVSSDGISPYTALNADLKPDMLLDRYHSHTKNCPVCSKALSKLERRKKSLEYICPALFGMTGTSMIASILSAMLLENPAASALNKLFGTSLLLSAISAKVKSNTGESIQKFHFVEHRHQD